MHCRRRTVQAWITSCQMRPTLQFLTEKTFSFKGFDFLTRHIMKYRFTSIRCKTIHVKATKTVYLIENHKHTFAPYVGRGVGPNSGLICSNNKSTITQIKDLVVRINKLNIKLRYNLRKKCAVRLVLKKHEKSSESHQEPNHETPGKSKAIST